MINKNLPKFIPKNSSEIHEKFINYIMMEGKKNTARGIFKECLTIISKKTSTDPEKIFKLALEKVKPLLEVKPKRIGGAVYQVPYEVKPHRQTTLALRWIVASARSKKGAKMAEKLAAEIIDASNEQGQTFKKREDSHKMAKANKAFAHFARY